MTELELTRSMHSTNDTCDPYWEHADWLPPWYILDLWCQQDARCRHAKQQALLSACERGEVEYRRSDGKTFDDPIHELVSRGIMLIDRDSFDAWAITVDGKSPLPTRPRKPPPYPGWASPGSHRFDEAQWAWVPASTPAATQASARPANTLPSEKAMPLAVASDTQLAGSDAAEPQTTTTARDDAESNHATYLSEAELRKLGVPTDEIISAFQVEDTRQENEKWWKERLANISRANKQLASALVQKGLPNRGEERYPSWWRPDLVAYWLIDARHLGSHKVAPILRKEFPKWAKSFDEQ